MKIKEWFKRRCAEQPLGRTIYASIMLVLFFLKAINFYANIDVGAFVLPLACVTTLFILGLYFVVLVFFPKAANVVLTVLYFLLSVIMSVDLVYYNCRGSLPAVALIKMAWQLTDVTDSIAMYINFFTLLPILDLPVWIAVLATRPWLKDLRTRPIPGFVAPAVTLAMTVAVSLVLAGGFLFGSFRTAYLPNEMMIYHLTDIKSALFPDDHNDRINKDNYTGNTFTGGDNYGIAEGRNVFVIQVEALQSFVIGKEYEGVELTPNLNSLIGDDSFYFENYYYQVGGGNTSDAEFAVNNSLYPREDAAVYEEYADNAYYGLPFLLKDEGYSTAVAFHGYEGDFWNRDTAYPYQGFDDYISIEDFRARDDYDPAQERLMGISDRLVFNQTLDIIKNYEEPFYSFIVTLSTHSPYSLPFEDRYVDADNMSPNLFELYIQSVCYFDRVLGEFLDGLREAGLYDNSIFVIYGDHYALTNTDEKIKGQVEDLTGESYDMFERFRVPLIIHIPGMEKAEIVDTVGGHVDVLPTLLYLLGLDNDKAVMFGHNLLDPDYEGVVYELTHLQKGSFITKDAFYMYTKGGINSRVYDRDGNFGDASDPKYLEIVSKAQQTLQECHALLASNNVLLD